MNTGQYVLVGIALLALLALVTGLVAYVNFKAGQCNEACIAAGYPLSEHESNTACWCANASEKKLLVPASWK